MDRSPQPSGALQASSVSSSPHLTNICWRSSGAACRELSSREVVSHVERRVGNGWAACSSPAARARRPTSFGGSEWTRAARPARMRWAGCKRAYDMAGLAQPPHDSAQHLLLGLTLASAERRLPARSITPCSSYHYIRAAMSYFSWRCAPAASSRTFTQQEW